MLRALVLLFLLMPSLAHASKLRDVVEVIEIPGRDSGVLSVPTRDQAVVWREVIRGLFTGYNQTLAENLGAVDFSGHCLPSQSQCQVFLLRSDDDQHFGGTFIFNRNYKRNLVIEVPHPVFDANTLEIGLEMFLQLGARGLLIAGTHRNASHEESSCSVPKTRKNPYRKSDVAHFDDAWFHLAHQALSDADDDTFFLSVHGFSKKDDVPYDYVIGNGTMFSDDKRGYSSRLAKNLDKAFGADVAISCNDSDMELYCGASNLQGRYTNGSKSVCHEDALRSSERFLHIEQSREVRDSKGHKGEAAYFKLIEVLADLLPEMAGTVLPPAAKIEGVASFAQGKNLCGPTAASMITDFHGVEGWQQYSIARHLYDLPDDYDWEDYRYTYRGRLEAFFKELYPQTSVHEGQDNFRKLKKAILQNLPVLTRAYWDLKREERHYRTLIGYDDFSAQVIYNESVYEEAKEHDPVVVPENSNDPLIYPGLRGLKMPYDVWGELWDVAGNSPSYHYMIVPKPD